MHSACAQGATGVGPTFLVTKGEGNIVEELDGAPALARLNEVAASVRTEERLLRLLADAGLLDPAQYGFILNGSCAEPLAVMGALYEDALRHDRELWLALLDATSAFDSMPHTTLDVCLRRLGAPEDFITWLRSMLHRHGRVAATAYGVDTDERARLLAGGSPQGCPSSPAIWAIVADFALTYARLYGGAG